MAKLAEAFNGLANQAKVATVVIDSFSTAWNTLLELQKRELSHSTQFKIARWERDSGKLVKHHKLWINRRRQEARR